MHIIKNTKYCHLSNSIYYLEAHIKFTKVISLKFLSQFNLIYLLNPLFFTKKEVKELVLKNCPKIF